MVTCLLFWLDATIEHFKAGNPWPQKLYIVMDNGSENRGVLFGLFVQTLVIYGFFIDIQLVYLPVGHSHYKCDQAFGVSGQFLKNIAHGCQTLSKFKTFLQDFEGGDSCVEYIEELYDWSLIVEMLQKRSRDKELMKISLEKGKGVKKWKNMSFTVFKDPQTLLPNILMQCHDKSIHAKDWYNLINNPCLLFFNKKIETMEEYYTTKCGDFVAKIYEKIHHNLNKTNTTTSTIIAWTDMEELELLSHTPMVPLKKLKFEDIQEYINEFGLEKDALKEWEELLSYFKKLEESSCLDCLYWYTNIKSKTFYAKCSKNVPGNKERMKNYKNELLKHLTKVNYHKDYYIQRNQRHTQHLFRALRKLKNKLQTKLNLQTTKAIDDRYSSCLYIEPNNVSEIKLNEKQQKEVEMEIMEKCCMLTGTLQQSLKVLNMESEFCQQLTKNVKKTYKNVSQRIQLSFANTVLRSKNNNNNNDYNLNNFTQTEIEEMIYPQQYAIYEYPTECASNQIMIISNENDENMCEHSWFLWYSWGICNAPRRKHILGTLLYPCGAYSLYSCWRFQETLQNNKRRTNVNWLNKCQDYINHDCFEKMKTIVSKVQVVDLYDIIGSNNDVKLYCLPLHLGTDFTLSKNNKNKVLLDFKFASVDMIQQTFTNTANDMIKENYKSNFFNSSKQVNHWFQQIFCHTEAPINPTLPKNITLQCESLDGL